MTNDFFFEGENLLRMVASAIVRLSQQSNPRDSVYDSTVQNTYNQLVLLCLRKALAPPASVPDMVRWAAERPIGRWPWTLPDDVDGRAFLVDARTRTPTQQCWEWRVAARDVAAEQVENQLMREAIAVCRAASAPESYTAFRRLLICRPVLTDAERAGLADDLDLDLLLEVIKHCYEPAPASYLRDGAYALCARCRCLLVPTGRHDYVCELDRCRHDHHPKVGQLVEARRGGGVFQLSRPMRMFITGPGLAETDLESALVERGLRPEMWPNFDAYDLRITLLRGRVWAVDVKDRSNPALLGRSAKPLRPDPPYDEGFLVAPQYRFDEREDYGRVYAHHRPDDLGGAVDLISDAELLARVDRELARSRLRKSTRKVGAADA